jgi:hypothetical protein
MKSLNVCTKLHTHGRIVSSNSQPAGATINQIKKGPVLSRLAEGSQIQIRNPHLNSQREYLLLGTIIEAGSGRQSEIRNPLEPLDLIPINLIYSLTDGSNLQSKIGRLSGSVNHKSPLGVSKSLYKIYNFTQNHTITSELYTAVKPLRPNKLAFASTPNDKISPLSLLYKNRSIKNLFSFSNSLPRFTPDSPSCVIAQKSHKRFFKKLHPTFATPMAYNQKGFDCNRTPPLPDLPRTCPSLSALTAEHRDGTFSSQSVNASHEKDRFKVSNSLSHSKIQIPGTLMEPLIIGHYRKLSALKFRPSGEV